VSDATGAVIATVVESDVSMMRRAGRLLNNLFPNQQRHQMEVRDRTGQTLLTIIRQPPKLGREYAEVQMAGGVPAGTVRLIRATGSDQLGLGLFDAQDAQLGEVRYSQVRTIASGHKSFGVFAADGFEIGDLASTRARGGGGPVGYRLRVGKSLTEPLRSLVYASPVVRYFIR
jgi:hypothetical protein